MVLMMTPDNVRMGRSALRLARLFLTSIVDRLHCVLLVSALDNRAQVHLGGGG